LRLIGEMTGATKSVREAMIRGGVAAIEERGARGSPPRVLARTGAQRGWSTYFPRGRTGADRDRLDHPGSGLAEQSGARREEQHDVVAGYLRHLATCAKALVFRAGCAVDRGRDGGNEPSISERSEGGVRTPERCARRPFREGRDGTDEDAGATLIETAKGALSLARAQRSIRAAGTSPPSSCVPPANERAASPRASGDKSGLTHQPGVPRL